MSSVLLVITLLFSIASPFAPGMIAFADFSMLASTPVAAETGIEPSSLIPLHPKLDAFSYGDSRSGKKEIFTTVNVLYKVHGDPIDQFVSAYDIRDKTLLWRKSFIDAEITGIELQFDGKLLVCGVELVSKKQFCLKLSDDGEYMLKDTVSVATLMNVITEQEKEKAIQAEITKKQLEIMTQAKEQKRIESSLRYKLQLDETEKASDKTLSDIVNENNALLQDFVVAQKSEKATPQTTKEKVFMCTLSNDVVAGRCFPDLTNEVLIQREMLPMEVLVIDAEMQEEAITQKTNFNRSEVVDGDKGVDNSLLVENQSIEGLDGIFNYDDVVDYDTCFHMCYYVENSSWSKCTKGCNDRF